MQSTNTILMVKPSGFRFNEETAVNNHFQIADESPVSYTHLTLPTSSQV